MFILVYELFSLVPVASRTSVYECISRHRQHSTAGSAFVLSAGFDPRRRDGKEWIPEADKERSTAVSCEEEIGF